MKAWRWVVLLGIAAVNGSITSLIVPDCAGDSGATSVSFSFPTADANPFIAESIPFGSVSSVLSLGGVNGVGWQDSIDSFAITRKDSTGACSIDTTGNMTIQMPYAADSLGSCNIEVVVGVMADQSPTALPDISVSGSEICSSFDTFLEEADTIGNWMQQVWTGTGAVAGSSTVTVDVSGGMKGSLSDSVAIYTRVAAIPEPAAFTLIVMTSGMMLVFRRRF